MSTQPNDRNERPKRLEPVGDEGRLGWLVALVLAVGVIFSGCAGSATQDGAAQGDDEAPTSTATAETTPTSLVIPTTAADPTATPEPADPTATPTTEPAAPTATTEPSPSATATPTVEPTPQPTATSAPVVPTATSLPTAVPSPTPVPPTPTATWVNPDCYVGPGAADEPVWWCGGRICVAGAPHYGCPSGPPRYPLVDIDCSVSDRDIVVNEIITLTALQDPVNIPVRYAFSHGDGTIDNHAVSRAYYAHPGRYTVTLLWQYNGAKGSTPCGTVKVRPTVAPTPTPGVVQIGCSISPSRTVQVEETLVFTAFQTPSHVPVTYVFDHGDGTLDETAKSYAYYAAPGFYDVHLRWAYAGQSGTTFCGTVTVEPIFSPADYLGKTPGAAESLAISRGLAFRIVRIDDEYFPGTTDYRLDRVNVEIDANVVTKVYLG